MKLVALFVVLLAACTFANLSLSANDQAVLLQLHNNARANATPKPKVALVPMTWNSQLAIYAQNTASKCLLNWSQYYYGTVYGENTYIFHKKQYYNVTQAVNAWLSTGHRFNWANGACTASTCQSWEQIVATNATQVGCGVSRCGAEGDIYLICNYLQYFQYPGVKPYVPATSSLGDTYYYEYSYSYEWETDNSQDNPPNPPNYPTQAPYQPTDQPVQPTDPPVAPTSAPVQPTDAPTQPTSAPSPTGYASIDYRGTDRVTQIKDQGQCGSCWAFSTTAIIEGVLGGAAGQTVTPLSEQDTLDCSDRSSGSCNGGWPATALQGMISQGGIDTDAEYPYTGAQESQCNYNSGASQGMIKNSGTADSSTMANIYAALKQYGPVGVAVNADNSWYSYSGGVMSSDQTTIDHAVTLVGYDSSKNAWIIKNSWGTSWGDSGYCYIDVNHPYGMNLNGCFWGTM